MVTIVSKRFPFHSMDRQPLLLLDNIFSTTRTSTIIGSTSKMVQSQNLTDSQKLDCLLQGFASLQAQYTEIKKDHEILRDECKNLKDENKRLKQALQSMSNGAGKEYLKCDDLLQEIVDLKEAISNGREELEVYKRMLEDSNANLKAALDGLKFEKMKKCNCFICRIVTWAGLKK